MDQHDITLVYDFAVFLQERVRDFDRAEEQYTLALAMDPSDPSVLNNYAIFLSECRNNNTAAEAIFVRSV